jgi:hypothetical protein
LRHIRRRARNAGGRAFVELGRRQWDIPEVRTARATIILMPRSAIAAGWVEFVLAPETIAKAPGLDRLTWNRRAINLLVKTKR